MGFFSSAWKALTGSEDRRRARDQADAQLAIQRQQMENQRNQLIAQKRQADRDLLNQQARDKRDTIALAKAQALSNRAKGLADDEGFLRQSGSGTNSGGIIV